MVLAHSSTHYRNMSELAVPTLCLRPPLVCLCMHVRGSFSAASCVEQCFTTPPVTSSFKLYVCVARAL